MDIIKKYADLLLDYCLEVKEGHRLYVASTTLAEPLLKEIYRGGLKRGAHVLMDVSMEGMDNIFYNEANNQQLEFISPNYEEAIQNYDAYLVIRAPFNLRSGQNIDPDKKKHRAQALKKINQLYFKRTGEGSMVRSLCQYPTLANAQEAGMSLEEYQKFIYNACKLYSENPAKEWLNVRKKQQAIVDFLNQSKNIRYVGPKTDISFSVEGRTWINSDGRTNMPSGEVFSAPVEDSVNGFVYFSYPSIFQGQEVRGVSLKVKNGLITEWDADQGKETLDKVFSIEGARKFGEVAIGTNYNIQEATKNILFDEKIGGTIHMAVGQSYHQAGGKNESPIHWDMITDMKKGGQIYADGKLFYENGTFLDFDL